MIDIQRLESGYVLVRGRGPCNWSQPPHWPCDEQTFRECAFPEASDEFVLEAMGVARECFSTGESRE